MDQSVGAQGACSKLLLKVGHRENMTNISIRVCVFLSCTHTEEQGVGAAVVTRRRVLWRGGAESVLLSQAADSVSHSAFMFLFPLLEKKQFFFLR